MKNRGTSVVNYDPVLAWGCVGKTGHANRAAAMHQLKRRKGARWHPQVKLEAYQCRECGQWHVGNAARDRG